MKLENTVSGAWGPGLPCLKRACAAWGGAGALPLYGVQYAPSCHGILLVMVVHYYHFDFIYLRAYGE